MTTYIQRHVYLNAEQDEIVRLYLQAHDEETFSGLMKRLLLTHCKGELLCGITTKI